MADNPAAPTPEHKLSTNFWLLWTGQAISALEPDIVPVYKVGLLHTETASVDSPGAAAEVRRSHSTGRETDAGDVIAEHGEFLRQRMSGPRIGQHTGEPDHHRGKQNN